MYAKKEGIMIDFYLKFKIISAVVCWVLIIIYMIIYMITKLKNRNK